MKRLLLVLFCLGLGAITVSAQKFNVGIETRYTDFKRYDDRTLVVEILEQDAFAIAKLTKMKDDEPDALDNYIEFVKTYNERLKAAVEKHWKITAKIEYKTPKEIKQLIEGRDRNSVILSPVEIGGSEKYITRLEGTAIQLTFYRSEKGADEPDYKIVLPYANTRKDWLNSQNDYMFTISMANRNINYMIDKRVTSDMFDFMQSEAMANCKKMEKKELKIDEELLSPKADVKGIRKYYDRKKVKVIKKRDQDELEQMIANNNSEISYIMLIPYSAYTNPFGREKKSHVLCYKVIVNAEDGTVLNYMEGKAKATPDVSLLQEKDFKELDGCEF